MITALRDVDYYVRHLFVITLCILANALSALGEWMIKLAVWIAGDDLQSLEIK
jgi:hypothetical protein